MKRMLKKWAAIALAGAMALSLCVSALADAGDPTELGRIEAASGQATGSGTTTGGIPADVIKIKLPVNAAAGTFNMYFDPHNMIRQSNNALELGGSDATFADDTLVYFKNKGDTVSFSKTSDPIKVINKSSVPVSVDMTATWNNGGSTYKLARTADELAQLKEKGEAALFLYVEEDHTKTTSPVVDDTRGVPEITVTYTAGTAVGTAPSPTSSANLQYLTKYIKSVKFAYTKDATPDDVENINKGDSANHKTPADWEFTITGANNKTPAVASTTLGDKIPAYVSYNSSGNPTTTAYKAQAAAALEIVSTPNADGTKTFTMKDDVDPITVLKIQRGTVDVATITFEWDYEAIGANGFAVTENHLADPAVKDNHYMPYTIGLSFASGAGAKVETDLNRLDGAYRLTKDTATTLKWDLAENGVSYEEGDDDKWENVSFRLNAAITDGDVCAKAWDTAFTTGQTGVLSLIWKASACPDFDPVVKVKSALTSATGTATLDVDWGVGAKKTTTISKAVYEVNGTATELPSANIAINGKTVTITSVAGLFNAGASGNNAGANGVITLTFKHADTGYATKVTVNLKEASA